MLILDARQEALLRLPNRFAFLPRLAAEIRRDLPEYVRGLDDRALLIEVQRCYDHASQSLGITRLPVLVQWTKTDVGSGGELHRNTEIDMAMRLADSPDTMAARSSGCAGCTVPLADRWSVMASIPIRWGIGKLAERAAAATAAAAAAHSARESVKDLPVAKAREADCADTSDATGCGRCLLGDGRVGQPPTPRYVTHRNRINYDYQIQIANMHAGPEHFGYVKRGDATDELVNIELDTLRHFFGRGGEYTTLEWLFGGKSFDGFWRSRCTVVEAKANFGHFFDKDGGEAKPFTYAVVMSWVALYREQEKIIMPVKPRGRLEWHFMEHSAFVAGLAAGLPAVVARVTPYVLGSI